MTDPVKWTIKGRVAIACNCEVGCPCNVNGRPTHGHCEGGWVWWIEAGSYGQTKLDKLHVALFADWPAAIHEGNGVAVTFIDESADEAQRAALRAMVQGEAGGPWGSFIRPSRPCTDRRSMPSRVSLRT